MNPRRSFLAYVALLALAACDPVHANAKDALGGEAPGVRTGPMHRPGQPCLICHDGAFGDQSQFTVAGTVFTNEGATSRGEPGVVVCLTDATGAKQNVTTNEAGNFYLTPREWTPSYPMKVSLNCGTAEEHPMQTHIGRDGSCAGCHVYPPGPESPGHVALNDGGLP